LQPLFWKGWLERVGRVVGQATLVAALFGVLVARTAFSRALLLGLWAGYGLYGLIFPYHIHTHDYYQLPLVPIVALSLAPIGASVTTRLGQVCSRWYCRAAVLLGTILFAVIVALTQWLPIHPSYARQVATAREVGEAVNHSTKTVFLAPYYGEPLIYHGELSGVWWPHTSDLRADELRGLPPDAFADRFRRRTRGFSAEYFIVTDFRDYAAQEDLQQFLSTQYPVLAQNRDYLIFDLRRKRDR
jgi:hypothetical protein